MELVIWNWSALARRHKLERSVLELLKIPSCCVTRQRLYLLKDVNTDPVIVLQDCST